MSEVCILDPCLSDASARLSKIEGQIRGIRKMLEEKRECEEVLMQISAANASLTGVAKLILEHHIEHCVVSGIKHGNEQQTMKELRRAIDQFSKLK